MFTAARQPGVRGHAVTRPARCRRDDAGDGRRRLIEGQVELHVVAGREDGERDLLRRQRADDGLDRRHDGAGHRGRGLAGVAEHLDVHEQAARARGAQRGLERRGHPARARLGARSVRDRRSAVASHAHRSRTAAVGGVERSLGDAAKQRESLELEQREPLPAFFADGGDRGAFGRGPARQGRRLRAIRAWARTVGRIAAKMVRIAASA